MHFRVVLFLLPPLASWVKKSKQGKKLQISDRILTQQQQILTEQIMNAQNFNFASTFPQDGDFRPQILRFWPKIFKKEDFLTIFGQSKNSGWEQFVLPVLPPGHDAIAFSLLRFMSSVKE